MIGSNKILSPTTKKSSPNSDTGSADAAVNIIENEQIKPFTDEV